MEKEGIEALSVRQVGRPAMIEALLTRCRQLRHDDPEQMVFLAWQATWVASRLDQDGFTKEQVMDLRARTEGEYANALRVADLVTAGLLESVAEFMRRSEHDLKARFELRFG